MTAIKRLTGLLLTLFVYAALTGQSNRDVKIISPFNLAETEYVVTVDLSQQRVFVYKEGEMIRTMVCSSGIPTADNATPTGRFIIDKSGKKRGEWFFSKTFHEGAEYWVGFIGGIYLFHSVPMTEDRVVIHEQETLLGRPSSHGCIRLSVEDAQWFYENVPSGSILHIYGITPGEEWLPHPPITEKKDAADWLTHNHQSYYQQHVLSCEAALIRLFLAMADIEEDEDTILDRMPKGFDPETTFVCTNIDQGRRGKDGEILWDNYGAHPPVVKDSLEYWLSLNGKDDLYEIREEILSDGELKDLCLHDESFLGAIIWVIGHPTRWGPKINERGMVLGEHVRYLNPELDDSGDFLIWDPEISTDQPRHYTEFPTRAAFENRVLTIRTRE